MSDMPIRTLQLVDLPRVHRLIERAVTLDTALAAVEGTSDSTTALISRLIKERGLHTFVGKVEDSAVMGQYRLKPDSTVAQITLIAPDPPPPQ